MPAFALRKIPTTVYGWVLKEESPLGSGLYVGLGESVPPSLAVLLISCKETVS